MIDFEKSLQEGLDNPREMRHPSITQPGLHTLELSTYKFIDGEGPSGLAGVVFGWKVIESSSLTVGATYGTAHFLNGVSSKGAQATVGMRRAASAELVEVLCALLGDASTEITAKDLSTAIQDVDGFQAAFLGTKVQCESFSRASKDGERTYINCRWSPVA